MIKFKAARERVFIIPPERAPLISNVRLYDKSSLVYDGINFHILILDDNSTKVCLLGFDLIGLEYSTCNDIKTRIEQATDIPAANIVIWANHTFSKAVNSMLMYQGNKAVNQYIEDLSSKVVEGVIKANGNFEEVSLKTGKTNITDLNLNMQVRKDGSVITNSQDFGINDIVGTSKPIENELITLSLWDKSDKLFALLVNFITNPAIRIGYKGQYSRDVNNYLYKYITDNFGKQAATLFANGAWGNINHIDDQGPGHPENFEETERIGKELGGYVSETIKNSSHLDGKIRFTSVKSKFQQMLVTEDEKKWADLVLEINKDLDKEQTGNIGYAKMIREMAVDPRKEFETVLQGMAIHNFALVTFPGEFYPESGLEVKEFSPYDNTMVISMANSRLGCAPKEAFSPDGLRGRTPWIKQLAHDAGEILVKRVKDNILDNLKEQSVKVMERKAADNKYLHKDFHLALNLLITYINDHFGKDALLNYLKEFSQVYYSPLSEKLKSGDKEILVNHFKDVYSKEEWPVKISSLDNTIVITQEACPGISHILKKGGKPCPHYRETYNTVYKTICENTPFEYSMEYFNDETGACKQLFIKKEEKL